MSVNIADTDTRQLLELLKVADFYFKICRFTRNILQQHVCCISVVFIFVIVMYVCM